MRILEFFLRKLAKYIAYELHTIREVTTWAKVHGDLIRKERATAVLEAKHIPTDTELYLKHNIIHLN